MKHPLLTYSTVRPYRAVPDLPRGATYDTARGVWLRDGRPLVDTEEFRMGGVTKKCDQETGEDQKGE